MLTIFRRHLKSCKHSVKGRNYRSCACPIAVEGILHGESVRKSLDVRSWEAAQKLVREWEVHGLKAVVSLSFAYERFIAHHHGSKLFDMKPLWILCLCVLCLVATGCDNDRISKLEKENQEMKAKLEKSNVTQEYELQARCSKDARAWFNTNWPRDKSTTLLDFSNHYNAKHNKCMIFVEFHYVSPVGNFALSSWTNDMSVTDVYENVKYATFSQNHVAYSKPTLHMDEPVVTCEVEGNKCKTIDEFNNRIRPYMND